MRICQTRCWLVSEVTTGICFFLYYSLTKRHRDLYEKLTPSTLDSCSYRYKCIL